MLTTARGFSGAATIGYCHHRDVRWGTVCQGVMSARFGDGQDEGESGCRLPTKQAFSPNALLRPFS